MVPNDDLRKHWDAHPQWHEQETRAAREATLPALRGLIESFRSGTLDLTEFRRRIDSLSKQRETGVWGFRGNAGVMFFTMLWKGAAEEFAPLLRTVIASPPDDAGAREAINQVRALARATKARTGNRNIHEKFAPFFLSFFWEAQDREQWPMFHPASREGLERLGLVSLPDDVSDAYLAFRHAMQQRAGHWASTSGTWSSSCGASSTRRRRPAATLRRPPTGRVPQLTPTTSTPCSRTRV